MEKFDDLLNKFQQIKNNLDQKDIHFLCAHSFKSILYGIKGIYKDLPSSPNQKSSYSSKKEQSNAKSPDNFSNVNKDSLKNLAKILEDSKNNKKVENDVDKSPSVYNDDEKNNNDNTISLKEEDEEKLYSNNTKDSSKEKLKSPIKRVVKKQQNISSISAFDNNNDVNFNIFLKDSLTKINNFLTELSKKIPKISIVEGYFAQNKNSLESSYNINSSNYSIEIKAIKSLVHLLFNTLSKILSVLTKETENICKTSSQSVIILISIIIDIIIKIIKFIEKNNENIDLNFLKDIKLVGNYCKYILIIKRDDFEQMKIIKEKNDNDKINKFFDNYLIYFKCVKKLRNIIKDNEFFNKFFNMQPTMISYIDLFEINRKLINFHLNVNYKK